MNNSAKLENNVYHGINHYTVDSEVGFVIVSCASALVGGASVLNWTKYSRTKCL